MPDYNLLPDEKIVEKVRSEDQELYSVLVDRYQSKLLRYVTSIVRDEHKSADIVQETFLKAFINLHGFNSDKKFSSWIYRIAHNEAINLIKKNRKEITLPEDFDTSSEEDLEESLELKEMSSRIREKLGEIPLKYSEPLSLYYFEELNYQEISDVLHLPTNTVATRIRRARALIKHLCQKK